MLGFVLLTTNHSKFYKPCPEYYKFPNACGLRVRVDTGAGEYSNIMMQVLRISIFNSDIQCRSNFFGSSEWKYPVKFRKDWVKRKYQKMKSS